MSKSEVKKIVERYKKALKKADYPFTAVYLFGSYAKGEAREGSDIDIAVLSEKLRKNWNKNEELLWKLGAGVDFRIEPVGFTPEDFKSGIDPIVREVKETGIRVG
jgi:predicted nucleotidyltransferase